MNRIIEKNLNRIKALCDLHKVKSLHVFGSAGTDQMKDDSDIDFLVSFEQMNHSAYAEHYFLMAEKLEEVFNRPVDLVTEASLGNPFFIDSVNKTKIRIYG